MDAEVPDGEVDDFVGDNFHEGELAELEVFSRGDLHPVAAGEDFGFGLDEINLVTSGAEETDLEAINDAGTRTHIGAKNDVRAYGRAAIGSGRSPVTGAVGVDGYGFAASGWKCGVIGKTQIKNGIGDVELDERRFAFELHELMRAGEWIDGSAENVVGGDVVQLTFGLGHGD